MSAIKFPEVYSQPIKYKPNPKLGQLTDDQIKQFYNEGYVIIDDFFDKDILEKAKESIENLANDM